MRKYIILLLLPLYLFGGKDAKAIWLTWQQDPTTTMTIQWLAENYDDSLQYRGLNETEWHDVKGTHASLPYGYNDLVHRVELTRLKPNTAYEFQMDGKKKRFQTMPKDSNTPFHFIVGGDMYTGTLRDLHRMNREAAAKDPWFVVLGGDLAYSASRFSFLREDGWRWYDWLKAWSEEMVTPSGFLIPVIAVIGNHEVDGRFGQTPINAQFFYTLFPMPEGRAYRTLDFGNYMTLILLDSGHTAPVEGEQTDWLKQVLAERKNIPHKFAMYHVPAYPSIRNFTDAHCTAVRENWVPIFDLYHLNAAFEHHDHAYKRTFKLRDNQKDPNGTLYLGDGAWSPSSARKRKSPPMWYIEKFASKRHFYITHIDKNQRTYFAINEDGEAFDQYMDN